MNPSYLLVESRINPFIYDYLSEVPSKEVIMVAGTSTIAELTKAEVTKAEVYQNKLRKIL